MELQTDGDRVRPGVVSGGTPHSFAAPDDARWAVTALGGRCHYAAVRGWSGGRSVGSPSLARQLVKRVGLDANTKRVSTSRLFFERLGRVDFGRRAIRMRHSRFTKARSTKLGARASSTLRIPMATRSALLSNNSRSDKICRTGFECPFAVAPFQDYRWSRRLKSLPRSHSL